MNITATCTRRPWNKGKLVGQKTPLRLRDIWAIRVRLQLAERTRDLALFDLAIDSKLRACDLTKLRVCDVAHGEHVSSRAMVMQQKTKRPVQFEITEQTRSALAAWIHQAQLRSQDCLFPSRLHTSDHLSTRQYARIVKGWVQAIGLDPAMYGTHTMRRTKASLIYRRSKNLRAVQLLLGHTKLESTVRYLGIEVDDALEGRADRGLTMYSDGRSQAVANGQKTVTQPLLGFDTRSKRASKSNTKPIFTLAPSPA